MATMTATGPVGRSSRLTRQRTVSRRLAVRRPHAAGAGRRGRAGRCAPSGLPSPTRTSPTCPSPSSSAQFRVSIDRSRLVGGGSASRWSSPSAGHHRDHSGPGIALALNAFQGRGLLRAAVLIPGAIPTVVSAQMWSWMFNDVFGIINVILQSLGFIDQPIAWTVSRTPRWPP